MITIVMPWIDTILLPNTHDGLLKHGGRKAGFAITAARDTAKNTGYYAACQAVFGLDQLERDIDHAVSIVWNPPIGAGNIDNDGLSRAMKPTMDGIAQALNVNDFHFNPIEVRRGAKVEGGRVTVIIDDVPF